MVVGGHSGIEIDKNRANANKLMGRFLYELGTEGNFFVLVDLEGGTKDNAITRKSRAVLVADAEDRQAVKMYAASCQADFWKE